MLTSVPAEYLAKEKESPEREKYVAPPERKPKKEEKFNSVDELLRAELFGKPKVYVDVAGADSNDDGESISISTRSESSSQDPEYLPDSADISKYYEERSTSNTEAASTEPTTPSETDSEGTCTCFVCVFRFL